MSIAFLFPGQGSQKIGMGQAIAEAYPTAQARFAQADELLGFSLSSICFNGPEAQLNDTLNTQIAIFVTSIAILDALREAGYQPQPKFVAGHSLGEYTAYVSAGVLSFKDGVQLIRERGRLMQQAGQRNPGRMAALLRLTDKDVETICHQVEREGVGRLQIANINTPQQIVISGDSTAINRGIALAKTKRSRVSNLAVSVAAHSPLMSIVADDFQAIINKTALHLPQIPVIANITATPLNSVDEIRTEMTNQLTTVVRWSESIQYMIKAGVTKFVEIGPKKVLTSLLKRIDKAVTGVSIQTPKDIERLCQGN